MNNKIPSKEWLDNKIDEWHSRPEDGSELHTYLGLTWESYRIYVEGGYTAFYWYMDAINGGNGPGVE